ncbi:MAG: caspase family protein [Nitratireductor sp.]|nr:caspase family protein [Nitratireductor sp.]
MRLIRNALRVLFILVLVAAALPLARPASAAIQPGPGKGWLMIASRSSAPDAIALARRYAAQFPSVIVFSSSSGYFGVALGWADTTQAEPLRQSLVRSGVVPSDAYFTAGARLLSVVWSASNAESRNSAGFYAATNLLSGNASGNTSPAIGGQAGYVTGLDPNGDNFLSLRTGPGSGNREIARMLPNTPLNITGSQGNWYQVTLDNGMSGWAYGKYIAFGQIASRNVPTVGPSASAPIPEIGPGPAPDTAPPPASPPPHDVQQTAPQPEPTEQAKASPPPAEPEKPVAVADQKRVALVIGNSAYTSTVELPNPRNDAAAMSTKLKSLGFEVISSLDASKASMERAIRDYVRAMADADVVLFFYAGHGMQVNGTNYLIPVDAKLEDSTALDFETISLDTLLGFMNREGRISIALLDACRDNPLSRRFTRSLGATRSAFIGRGLAAPSSGSGQVLIGFATAPGEVALDGAGDNSPFTTALLDNIGTPGLEIELMLKRVKQEVYDATGKEQEPWHNSALRREFYFKPQ